MFIRSKIFLFLSICLIYNFLINTFYRPYIYANKINDFGFADVGNNIVFIPIAYLFLYAIRKKFIISKYLDIILHFGVLCIGEILSEFIPNIGTFDFKDILGLFIGAILVFLFIKNDQNNEIFN